ncbi:hypothetical protein OUZ56_030330 [Daphnia magna]|uniref:Uncharacterized protein n=1 Tax=Daphnia magna TaxID=35525 RepID=A0ABQ9ZQZ8_9CRUS|nr:hypothetical protein OUZ56_030330 [Daphnia magna]
MTDKKVDPLLILTPYMEIQNCPFSLQQQAIQQCGLLLWSWLRSTWQLQEYKQMLQPIYF